MKVQGCTVLLVMLLVCVSELHAGNKQQQQTGFDPQVKKLKFVFKIRFYTKKWFSVVENQTGNDPPK